MVQGIEPVTRTDISPGSTGVYVDVDVSSYVDAGNTSGIILEIINTNTSGSVSYSVRKNGSTDNLYYRLRANSRTYVAMGVDSNDILEIKIQSTQIYIYIVGYVPSDAGSFLTNASNVTPSNIKTWVDVDISSITGSDTAKIAFFLLLADGSIGFGLRENGSSDTLYKSIYPGAGIGGMMGVDSNEILEIYVGEDTWGYSGEAYLVGWIKDGYAETWVNAKDYSTNTTNSWVDTDMSSDVPSGTNGVFLHSGYFYYAHGIRKNGETYDNSNRCSSYHEYMWIACDTNRIIEQKITNTNIDLYLIGYVKSSSNNYYETISDNVLLDELSYDDIGKKLFGSLNIDDKKNIKDFFSSSDIFSLYDVQPSKETYFNRNEYDGLSLSEKQVLFPSIVLLNIFSINETDFYSSCEYKRNILDDVILSEETLDLIKILFKNIVDSINIFEDSLSVISTFIRTNSDTINISDVSPIKELNLVVSNNINLSDVLNKYTAQLCLLDDLSLYDSTIKHILSYLKENITLLDLYDSTALFKLLDGISLFDTHRKNIDFVFSDVVSLSEEPLDILIAILVDIADTFAMDEGILSTIATFNRVESDIFNIVDTTPIKNTSLTSIDYLLFSDSIYKTILSEMYDVLNIVDSNIKNISYHFSDNIITYDLLKHLSMFTLFENIILNDYNYKNTGFLFYDNIEIKDEQLDILKYALKTITDVLTIHETITDIISIFNRNYYDTIDLYDNITKNDVHLFILSNITMLDYYMHGVSKMFSDVFSLSDTIYKMLGLPIDETLSLDDSHLINVSSYLSSSIVVDDNWFLTAYSSLLDSVGLTEEALEKLLGISLSDDLSLADVLYRTFYFLTSDNINIFDNISTLLSKFVSISDIIGLSSSFMFTVNIHIIDTSGLSDIVKKSIEMSILDGLTILGSVSLGTALEFPLSFVLSNESIYKIHSEQENVYNMSSNDEQFYDIKKE